MKWHFFELRLTAFPEKPYTTFTSGFWESIILDKPEIQNFQPKKLNLHEEGVYGENNLIIDITPGRIDLKLSAAFKNTQDSEEFATLGEENNYLTSFTDLGVKFLTKPDFPPVRRLALGAVLVNPVKDLTSGYIELKELLRDTVKVDPYNSFDFLYQINKPTSLTHQNEDIRINLLRKYSVFKAMFSPIIIGESINILPKSKNTFATRLELDINTDAERRKALDYNDLTTLFKQLVNLTNPILEEDGV